MKMNIPPRVRQLIYIANGVLAPIMGYLLIMKIIGVNEMALYTAEMTFAFTMAGINTSTPNNAK